MLAPLLLAVVLVAVFHVIPTPSDVTVTPKFNLQGFVSEDDHTLLDGGPGFDPETDKYRPTAKISFVAPATGTCLVAETETIDGKTTYTVNGRFRAVEGERLYRRVVLLTADDLDGDDWQSSVQQRYRIVVTCTSGTDLIWSPFYEVPLADKITT
jgi:hypothetical protein